MDLPRAASAPTPTSRLPGPRTGWRRGGVPTWLALAAVLGACAGAEESRVALGPVDGHDLPAVDTGRVAVGDTAPDFALEAYGDSVVRLSDYRGAREVVLVFYRGHW